MCGVILFSVVTLLVSVGVIAAFASARRDDPDKPNFIGYAVATLVVIAIIASVQGFLFMSFVYMPSQEVEYEETRERYEEICLMAKAVESSIKSQDNETLNRAVRKYNEDVEWLKKHYQNWWYGVFIPDEAADLPLLELETFLNLL